MDNKYGQLGDTTYMENITITEEDPNSPDAIFLLNELSESLAAITGDSGMGSFDPNDIRVPRAVFVVARNQAGVAIGCGGFLPVDDNIAEVKRMYAKYKAVGIGTQILSYLEMHAQKWGYSALWLETRLVNQRAVIFYESRGYKRIQNYGKYVNKPEAVCFEKRLE